MNELPITHRIDLVGDAMSLIEREWLVTNGTGAYAMGTVPGLNTRRYHGLCVAVTRPPVGRVVALNQTLEYLVCHDGTVLPFSCFQFRDGASNDIVTPKGFHGLKYFAKGTVVVWHYERNGFSFTRRLILHWMQQAATLHYHLEGPEQPVTLMISPMLTLRDFHGLLRYRPAEPFEVEAGVDSVVVRRGGVAVTARSPRARFVHEPDWWYELYYPAEAERGQDDREDWYIPGRFEVQLDTAKSTDVTLTICLGDQPQNPDLCATRRHKHLEPILTHMSSMNLRSPTRAILAIAADDFVVKRKVQGESLSTILAGYPWFADWGRDTCIALPGLLLATGRFAEAAATLRTFAKTICGGLVPNRFDDYDAHAAHYNTVDASLWFVHAAIMYRQVTGDCDAWERWLARAAMSVIDAYLIGTPSDADAAERIVVDDDGLITAGTPQTQLTWMDAAMDGVVFTPRCGKAVEVNALWYHALLGMAELLVDRHRATGERYRRVASLARRAFVTTFWDEELGCLRDCVYSDASGRRHVDASLRPNQIFAVSLPHSPLPLVKQKRVLQVVKERLLTPFGLRTLASEDPNSHGHYTGTRFERDSAYHQGTVWPWLIGPYAEAVLRTGKFTGKAKQRARDAIGPLLDLLSNEGQGQLHEIHEGNPPHRPVGCMAQAWSVAEVLRVLWLIETSASHNGSTKSISSQSGTRSAAAASARKRRTASRPFSP